MRSISFLKALAMHDTFCHHHSLGEGEEATDHNNSVWFILFSLREKPIFWDINSATKPRCLMESPSLAKGFESHTLRLIWGLTELL